ncbi:AzlD domain-containing protein [Loktanella salsilacus]|jgi:branched-subunit amino acid transport protein|uniref:Branched-chain amino acid transport protein n=1 Tax=Loktanella salsilacus TaxID=195913 RepID=A0A1I4DVA1_9RHOB|nr:AzlD domain-containing protein [Loktanella salsilacus]MBU0782164.1 AzlD domain-containing protein [Alphaproteobacteria bacterium]MBU0861333.1 AzlD domain-containing protein [Alphaproteobacteria bacterium]MBU1834814.1 AzlD domain-containing protein [Alphaproteobacteria bacterium]UTH43773.1 AzlD domain-containing protein [Loktanella salsilacus]UTH47484.1 AzlD domain-containing protein [Loktanella salsilacus]|tara:strand:- start:1354 stop:1689 length:336 start_codon:yes stop_codon:yes gene_type:complete
MSYSALQIWGIIGALAIGTFLIRFSFLGLIGNRDMPPIVLRLLRYTPVAVLPGLVAPLVLWPAATGGQPDAVRLIAAAVALAVGLWTKQVIWAILAGFGALYTGLAVAQLL